ncbi:MAG: hypothetical protein RL682_2086, partial [Pseudomonadota bacterium]
MKAASAKTAAKAFPAVHYRIEAAQLHAHLFDVTLTITRPSAQQRLDLPVWIPGSYLVREFAKNLQNLKANQGERALTVQQLGKASWQVDCATDVPLTVRYQVYAFDNSVRTAWLDATRGFFNGTSLCLQAPEHHDQPHGLELVPVDAAPDWSAATTLQPLKVNKRGFGSYLAANYDELVDCPVEMGEFWSGSFTACGVPHRFVV